MSEARLFRVCGGLLKQFTTVSLNTSTDEAPHEISYEGRLFCRFFENGVAVPLSYYDHEDNKKSILTLLRTGSV